MRYGWNSIPALLRSPIGRSQLRFDMWYRSWPILSRLARLYRRSLVRNTRIVAVVGSFGKSTTARAVLTALGMYAHPNVGSTWNFKARAVLGIRPGDRHAVIEVGIDGPGQMAGFASVIRPDVTVVTSIGSEHVRELGAIEVTRAEKSEMVRILPASGIAVLNGDDPNVLWMKSRTCARVITFGVSKTNDICASDISLDWPNGTRFKLHADGETRDVRVRLIGKHMVYAILAAVAVALAEGFGIDRVIAALEALSPTSGRMEPILLGNGAVILRDEFKSPLETIQTALDTFSRIPSHQKIVVMGEIAEGSGDQRQLYESIGERIGNAASRVICVLDERRDYESCITGASRGGVAGHELFQGPGSVLRVAERLEKDLRSGGVVLVKGSEGQRLERVALALTRRNVRCGISFCELKVRCESCPMLERGWAR